MDNKSVSSENTDKKHRKHNHNKKCKIHGRGASEECKDQDGRSFSFNFVKGRRGHRGPQGPPGFNGMDGNDGKRGKRGHRGKRGKKGSRGEKGDKGEQGQSGILMPQVYAYGCNNKEAVVEPEAAVPLSDVPIQVPAGAITLTNAGELGLTLSGTYHLLFNLLGRVPVSYGSPLVFSLQTTDPVPVVIAQFSSTTPNNTTGEFNAYMNLIYTFTAPTTVKVVSNNNVSVLLTGLMNVSWSTQMLS